MRGVANSSLRDRDRDDGGVGANSLSSRFVSIPVPLERLRVAIEERGSRAYLLTTSDDGWPHAVHVVIAWDGERLVADVGTRTAANAAARPAASLLCPLRSPDDYSLIVDAIAAVALQNEQHRVLLTPTKAILHRPAAARSPTAARDADPAAGCDADCVSILRSPGR